MNNSNLFNNKLNFKKMKKNYFAIAAFAATALFASCDKDNDRKNPDNPGKATSMKVLLTFPNGHQTRATLDPNATDTEAAVLDVDVFIYYTSSGNFASHAHLPASAFTANGSNSGADVYEYTATTKVSTTTGAKTVFAGINLPSSVVNALKNQPINALSTVAQIMSREDLTTNGFAMFSVQGVNSTFVENENDPANKVTLRCQRLVAKVTVETSPTLDVAGVPGTLDNLNFAIFNFNTKLFMLQGAAEERRDPNWSLLSYVPGDFIDLDDRYAPILRRVTGVTPDIKTDYTPLYAAENTSEGKRKKEITRALVRATFIPESVTVGTTGNFTVNSAHGVTTPQTFYAVTPSVTEGTSYFFTQSIANAFAAEKGGTVLEYTNGLCYWDIFLNKQPLNDQNRWDVLRNDFYRCNITRIVAPGRNTPDVPDPEETPDVDTSITTSIEILFWHTPPVSDYVLD